MKRLEDLFKDLRVADTYVRRLDDNNSVCVVHVESETQGELINCVIELSVESAKEYGIQI